MKKFSVLLILAVMSLSHSANTTMSNFTNTTIALGYGDCINISSDAIGYNIFCAPSLPSVNINTTLNYSQSYYNSSLNITVTAPPTQSINQVANLSYGENYTNTNFNVTVYAPQFPTLSVNLTARTHDVTYNNRTITFTCGAADKHINRIVNFGDMWSDDYYGINITCPDFPQINQNKVLEWGEYVSSQQTDPRFNYTFSCKYFNNQTLIDTQNSLNTCKDDKDKTVKDRDAVQKQVYDLQAQVNSTIKELADYKNKSVYVGNVVCNTSAITLCPDQVAPMCTDQEKLHGDFAGCIDRVTKDANDTKNQYTVENAKCNDDLSQCRTGENTQREFQENIITIIGGVILIFGGAFLIAMWMKRKKVKEDGATG